MRFRPFSPKQLRALTWWCNNSRYAKCDALICDGAVRSGKTLCMGISFVSWALARFNGADFALCGKTIQSLERNMVTPVLPVLRELGFECRMRSGSHLLEISRSGKHCRFYLFGGKDESSCALIQGITLAGVLFDEVALMPRSFVEQALARCSVEGSKFWFNCNPEHPHHWFYQEWILRAEARRACYLHFCMRDNPSLSPAMIQRYEALYSGTFYQRFVEGKWVASQGAVYPFMANESAFCAPPEPPFEDYIVSCDYGTINPSSFGLWGLKDGVWYRLEEYYYDARREDCPRTDEEHYEGLCGLVAGRAIRCVIADPSAASFLAVIRTHGQFCVIPAENSVLDGIRQVSSALKQGRVRICFTCKDSMREFALYRWDQRGDKDIPIKQNDHAMDDIRYFVSTLAAADGGFYALASRRDSPHIPSFGADFYR